LSLVEHPPGGGDQDEPAADQQEAEEMERPEMRIGTPAEHHLEQMARIVGEPIDVRVAALQPSRQQIDAERESVHLREQGHQEGAERPERAPIPLGARLEEAEGKEDEDDRIENDQSP
jgi:hypothetical protein